ncbi:MAG: hypothetical protein EBV24_02670 [Actinobacteria bacterium]|nr:hypothetical protein [Actinomycetota bacterium]
MTIRRWVAISLVSIGFLLAADVARAHDPIILTDEQTTPDSGPFLPDGTISFALYGAFDAAGEITVIGGAPSRFTVSVGDKETFGTPVESVVDRSAGVAGVMQWYEGSPAPEMTETTTPESETTRTPTVDSSQRNDEELEAAGPENTEQDGALRTVIVLLVVLFLVVVVGISRKIRRRSTKSSQR